MGADTSVVKGTQKKSIVQDNKNIKHCPHPELSDLGWIRNLSLYKVDTYGICPAYYHRNNETHVLKLITPFDSRIFMHCAVDSYGHCDQGLDDDDISTIFYCIY